MGSDESHFNVLLIVRDKVTRQCPQTTTWERRAEVDSNQGLSAYQPTALLLGQTGSQNTNRQTTEVIQRISFITTRKLNYTGHMQAFVLKTFTILLPAQIKPKSFRFRWNELCKPGGYMYNITWVLWCSVDSTVFLLKCLQIYDVLTARDLGVFGEDRCAGRIN